MNSLTFKVPLTRTAHLQAQQASDRQMNARKIKQVYLNHLALYAVKSYLNCLGFSADWEGGDSTDPSFQTLSDVADLIVENWGKLECRPVLPDATTCKIPPEVWEDRAGYIAVQFDRELSEATLLGFIQQVEAEEIPLEKFQSLEVLLDAIHESTVREEAANETNTATPVQLNHWLKGVAETGWATLEELLAPSQYRPAFNFRRAPIPLSQDVNPVRAERAKLLQFQDREEQIALIVRLIEEKISELDISVEILPSRSHYFPSDVRLMILDENDRVALQAEAGGSEGLEVKFSGEPGERFSIEVVLGECKIAEQFIV
ncbi:DUF1822 family protein [Oscillatoria sp. FACHB-1406]|uniref:DUF1822 family protein n=1 Tax=Oscillatoria sp. FACHB-1406 TaxID=2692846 RepID=UPI00168380DB|nr:DUF1822 family protein [Oscillatoria sp. FACHB-1406]MBD2579886.1 DUF1822 family protein [Oscillatoria sp. FACHB-1406]